MFAWSRWLKTKLHISFSFFNIFFMVIRDIVFCFHVFFSKKPIWVFVSLITNLDPMKKCMGLKCINSGFPRRCV
ncbi:hypothetical protein OIU77_029050 [Salix suchowensis]|uniref:Uncharacterized protein n=1 Tax=Salix suchowensis TaxID=1278906 RepID=A0ABQ9BLL9_9ROSI|nr:hypothetical protein OIU77_029050 [Salix suchowensis]